MKPSYSLPENILLPFSNLINELDRPLDRYLGTCPKYELCRAAMILKQKDEISVLQVEQLWIDLNSKNERQKMTLVNPISASGAFSKVAPESDWLTQTIKFWRLF